MKQYLIHIILILVVSWYMYGLFGSHHPIVNPSDYVLGVKIK